MGGGGGRIKAGGGGGVTRGGDRPPSLDDIARLAEATLATLPAPWRERVRGVLVRVEDLCDEETEREMGLESPFELLGLYRGVDLTRKSLSDPVPHVDMIFLYRRAILDYWCESGESLARVVRHVLIHEIGHHFGLSDEEMERIENAP